MARKRSGGESGRSHAARGMASLAWEFSKPEAERSVRAGRRGGDSGRAVADRPESGVQWRRKKTHTGVIRGRAGVCEAFGVGENAAVSREGGLQQRKTHLRGDI